MLGKEPLDWLTIPSMLVSRRRRRFVPSDESVPLVMEKQGQIALSRMPETSKKFSQFRQINRTPGGFLQRHAVALEILSVR